MNRLLYLLLIISIMVFVGCDAEFDPNDDWTEKMMVYCLLDQDDDTTYVRVEKCFLGNGNAYEFAKNKDSVYYKPDELEVKMYAASYWNPNVIDDTLIFSYTTVAKDSGDFYFDASCPIYACDTKGRINKYKIYTLVVRNVKTGMEVRSKVNPVADYDIKTYNFTFTEAKGTMSIDWASASDNMGALPKQFQVNIRLNYTQNGQIRYLDIPVTTRTNSNPNFSITARIDTTTLLTTIRYRLKNETGLGYYGQRPFEIRIAACDLNMFDYLSINNASSGLNYVPVYSNIENGFGLFAARRNHIYKGFSDNQIDANLRSKIAAILN